jgi:hypothetical protein
MTRSLNYFLKIFMFGQLMLLLLGAMAANASENRDKDMADDAIVIAADTLASNRVILAIDAVSIP